MRDDVELAGHGLLDLCMGRDTIEAEGSAFLVMECVRVMTMTHGKR
jgi:hypothetical protein